MADQTPPPDPGAAFRDWVTQWERSFDAFANQIMGTEGFSQAMNEAQKAQLNAQRMFAQAMTQQLTSMNMPTRDDVLRLGEVMAGIERRLQRIEEKLGVDEKPASTSKRPSRTKKPPVDQETAPVAAAPAAAPTAKRETSARKKTAAKKTAATKRSIKTDPSPD